MTPPTLTLTMTALRGVPPIAPGDDLAAILANALRATAEPMLDGDVLVVTHKVVSKAEGRYANLDRVVPSERARALAEVTGKDPALVEVILSQSTEVVRCRPGLIIVEHRLGMVMANAGIDQSNLPDDGGRQVLLLPEKPDASAAALAEALSGRFAARIAVIVTDSVGRAWRNGVVGLAIGVAGLPALLDQRGRSDLFGRPLEVTQTALADQIASAALLLMGEADEGLPAVLVRGLRRPDAPPSPARALIRPREADLFR
jgi:coenzyme F420-0:L-glutamate ligase/coenzyme F420-1:gamma-L-glutamate ligase